MESESCHNPASGGVAMDKASLVDWFSRKLFENDGALLVGAGISVPSGGPSWLNIMKPLALRYLDMEISETDNLPQIAQYIVNQHGGNRGPLVNQIRDELARLNRINDYHVALARMNTQLIWTTNFDNLIERALGDIPFYVRHDEHSVARPQPDSALELIKIHGCAKDSSPEDLVLTQQDYEDFFVRHPAMAQRLQHDLMSKSFLLVGYSYRDQDVANILAQVRRLSGSHTREHAIVLEKDRTGPAGQQRQRLWCGSLSGVGIMPVLIDSYDELKGILESIASKSRGPTVFVTGSHKSVDDVPFLSELGSALAATESPAVVLIDGQSDGVGRTVVQAFSQTCIRLKHDIYDRIRLFPNPYAANPSFSDNRTLLGTLKKWRTHLIRATQVVVVFDGGMGTEAEVSLALENGCHVLPVPGAAEGLAARLLSRPEVADHLNTVVPEYVGIARNESRNLAPQDVVECIQKLLSCPADRPESST